MAMRIGAEISQALSALDRQVQLATNTASLAVIKDKHVAQEAAESEEGAAVEEGEEIEGADAALGNNIDVEA